MTSKPDERKKTDREKEDELEEALEESFPASDPPAITDPSRHVGNAGKSGKKPSKDGGKK